MKSIEPWKGGSHIVALALVIAGCGQRGPQKYLVTGEVTWNKSPLAQGNIILLPTDGTIVPDAGSVTDGKFSFMAREGAKRVQIFASRVTAPAVPGKLGETREQYIPARYNTQSELTGEVRPETDNRLSFDLTGDS